MAAARIHHVNLLSGRRYRGANQVLLTLDMHLRGAALHYWCCFAEAKALGIFPRKAESVWGLVADRLNASLGPTWAGQPYSADQTAMLALCLGLAQGDG